MNQLHKIQVLIVDDEKLIQRLVYDVLIKLGFRSITVANSGRRAMELVSQHRFDFVITDWRMQDLDGIDFLRYVRSSPDSPCPRIPVIFLTGNTEVADVTAARDAGVNEYLIKPFSAEQLVKRIRAIIENPRSFIDAPGYRGPERRHRSTPPPEGVDRRNRDNKK